MYVSLLSSNPHPGSTPGNGRFAALSMKTGQVVWSKPIPAGTESSPIAWGNAVYFGDQSGTVYSLNATTGQVNWTYHASGPVKGGPALSDGILYFGDYSGRAYAVNAATGHQIWAVNTNGADFGFGSGNFYSTPAVAFGRVYMGNTDGRVYSFAQKTGQLAWATGTGAYVYASPAVENTPGLGPTVYLGSYDGNFYAFNAQSGAIRWKHPAGGKISGSATIVGNVVYYSDLGTKTTAGLDVRTGHQVFSFPDGAFNPVVCDDHGDLPERLHDALPDASESLNTELAQRANLISTPHSQRLNTMSTRRPRALMKSPHRACNGARMERAFGSFLLSLFRLCVVVVEVIARSRPSRAVGSARSTRRSSIACARSSRTPLPPASVGVGLSGRLLAAVLAVMSPAFRPPRIAMHAPPPDTWKRPLNAAASPGPT